MQAVSVDLLAVSRGSSSRRCFGACHLTRAREVASECGGEQLGRGRQGAIGERFQAQLVSTCCYLASVRVVDSR